MAQKRPDLIDWLGMRRVPDFTKARWLGWLISVLVIGLLAVFWGSAVCEYLKAVWSDDPQGIALRNTGLVLAAMTGVPFLVWRTVVAQQQADTATEALFNDKINAAADDLHARRSVTMNPDDRDKDNRWDYWQDDIVRRNAAIDRLEGLAIERPDVAPRIARMLGIYVRELSRENEPQAVPDDATLDELRDWAGRLRPCRPDMENAAQTLGRLQKIDGVDPDAVAIDLRGANLQGFDLRETSLTKARLDGAQIQGAVLIGTEMKGADLSWAQMQGTAHLFGVQMQGADLSWVQMQGADLRRAQMDSATSLTGAMLQGAAVKEVDYSDVSILQDQVDSIFYDGSVTFPEHLDWERDRPKIKDWSEFETQWREWQESIGFDPEKHGA